MSGSVNNVKIRAAKAEDMGEVADMIQELADFENVEKGAKISAADLKRDGFESNPPAFKCLVAELQDEGRTYLVGYALYFPTYTTWQGRAMMLRDIYIRPIVRKKGVGKRLFNAVAKEATTSGCSRLEFHVLGWNDARAFYESRGALDLTGLESWRYYRISDEALEKAAEEADL